MRILEIGPSETGSFGGMADRLFSFFFYLPQIKVLAESAAFFRSMDMKQIIFSITSEKPEVSIHRIQQSDRKTTVYVGRKTVYFKLLPQNPALPNAPDNTEALLMSLDGYIRSL